MVLNKAGKDIPECYANQYGVFENETANIHAYKEESQDRASPARQKQGLGQYS